MPARRVVINGVEQIDPRHTRAWRTLRDQVVKDEPRCQLRLPGCTLVSTTAAHIKPVVDFPELTLERTNVQGSCIQCNEASGTTPREALLLGGADDDGDRPALKIFGR